MGNDLEESDTTGHCDAMSSHDATSPQSPNTSSMIGSPNTPSTIGSPNTSSTTRNNMARVSRRPASVQRPVTHTTQHICMCGPALWVDSDLRNRLIESGETVMRGAARRAQNLRNCAKISHHVHKTFAKLFHTSCAKFPPGTKEGARALGTTKDPAAASRNLASLNISPRLST